MIVHPSLGPRVVEHSNDWGPGDTWDEVNGRRASLLARMYNPLPVDDDRVVAWMADLYRHFKNCYWDEVKEEIFIYYKTVIYKRSARVIFF